MKFSQTMSEVGFMVELHSKLICIECVILFYWPGLSLKGKEYLFKILTKSRICWVLLKFSKDDDKNLQKKLNLNFFKELALLRPK